LENFSISNGSFGVDVKSILNFGYESNHATQVCD